MLTKAELLQRAVAESSPQPDDRPKIIGYGRRWSGGCDHCKIASQRLYFRGDLAPIHDGCSCGVYPVFEGEDHGLFHTREKLTPLPNSWVIQDGTLGPKLNQSAQTSPPFVDKAWLDSQFDRDAHLESRLEEGDQEAEEIFSFFDQYNSNDYRRINSKLREGDPEWEDWATQWVDKMETLDTEVRMFRGIGKSYKDTFGKNPQVGDVLHDGGFISTTLSKDIATDFAGHTHVTKPESQFREGDGVLVEILIPKGTKCAWLGAERQTGEQELVVERGLDMEVVEVITPQHIVVRILK